jgi:hypothetical protein
MVDVTKEQVKAILKKTQLSKYEHCSYIVSQLRENLLNRFRRL